MVSHSQSRTQSHLFGRTSKMQNLSELFDKQFGAPVAPTGPSRPAPPNKLSLAFDKQFGAATAVAEPEIDWTKEPTIQPEPVRQFVPPALAGADPTSVGPTPGAEVQVPFGLVGRGAKQYLNKSILDIAEQSRPSSGIVESVGLMTQVAKDLESLPEDPTFWQGVQSIPKIWWSLVSNYYAPKSKLEREFAVKELDKLRPAITLDVPPAEGAAEKAVDITAGIGAFVTQLLIVKKLIPTGTVLSDAVAWEILNQAEGGIPGQGAAIRGSLGALGKIPTVSAGGKAAKIAAGGGLFGGLTAVQGGNFEDIAVSTAIGAGFQAWGIRKQTQWLKGFKQELLKAEKVKVQGAKSEGMRRNAERYQQDLTVAKTPEQQAKASSDLQKRNLSITENANTEIVRASGRVDKIMVDVTQKLQHGKLPPPKGEQKFAKAKAKAHKQLQSSDPRVRAAGQRVLDFLEKKAAGAGKETLEGIPEPTVAEKVVKVVKKPVEAVQRAAKQAEMERQKGPPVAKPTAAKPVPVQKPGAVPVVTPPKAAKAQEGTKQETARIAKTGEVSDEFLFHTTDADVHAIFEEGLVAGGLSGGVETGQGLGDMVVVFRRSDFPKGFASFADVAFAKNYTPVKPVAAFSMEELGVTEREFGFRAEELGDHPEPPTEAKPAPTKAQRQHKAAVEQLFKKGKPVAQDLRDMYPDLVEKYEKAKGKEEIVAAVVKIGDQTFEGTTHAEAVQKAVDAGVVHFTDKGILEKIGEPGAEIASDLFKTSTGQTVDRLAASKITGGKMFAEAIKTIKPAPTEAAKVSKKVEQYWGKGHMITASGQLGPKIVARGIKGKPAVKGKELITKLFHAVQADQISKEDFNLLQGRIADVISNEQLRTRAGKLTKTQEKQLALQPAPTFAQVEAEIDKAIKPAPKPTAVKAAKGKAIALAAETGKKTLYEKETPREVQEFLRRKHNLAPLTVTKDTKDAANVMDAYFAEGDDQTAQAKVEGIRLQKQVKQAMKSGKFGPKQIQADMAIQVYIDLKNNPDQLKYYSKLTGEQKALVDLAQNLPAELKAIADDIIKLNKEIGLNSLDRGVIGNVIENYSMRLWEGKTQKGRPLFRKFGTKTARAKHRTLEGILHGWSLGKKLRVKGATSAHVLMRTQVGTTIVDRQLLKTAKQWGLISNQQHEEWVKIEHPNFTDWKWAGKAEDAKTYGRNFFVTEDGNLMERVPMYAEPVLGKHLNNALGTSKLYDIPGVKTLTEYNAILKRWILFTSFFHHQAYLRSYMLGGKTGLRNLSPTQAYKAGKRAIENYTPDFQRGVRNGLTVGLMQDFDEVSRSKISVFGRMLNHVPVAGHLAKGINWLRVKNEDWLFGKIGPYLKAQAYLLEYAAGVKKHEKALKAGVITLDDIAATAANLANDDFGGLHLRRMGRNPTLQHIFRLLALAPDWTESNVRSAVKAFALNEEGRVYRAFWARIAAKGLLAIVFFNYLMSLFDDEKDFVTRYQEAWKNGKMRWMDIDITPLYRATGGKADKQKYFSLFGHFKDPAKFIAREKFKEPALKDAPDPVRSLLKSAKYKGSVITRIFADGITGKDWKGSEFTTLSELLGTDDKGVYATTRKAKYKKGDPKGGKLKGKLTKWSMGGVKPLGLEQVPSFLIYEAKAATPIQVQNGIHYLLGQMDGFDAVLKGLGAHMSSTYDPAEKYQGKSISELKTIRKDYVYARTNRKLGQVKGKPHVGKERMVESLDKMLEGQNK